jgi:hypothetical protein
LGFFVLRNYFYVTKNVYYLILFWQPPSCGANRLRRQATGAATPADPGEGTPATIEVYSGLYVNEANDLAKAGLEEDSVFSEKVSLVSHLGIICRDSD